MKPSSQHIPPGSGIRGSCVPRLAFVLAILVFGILGACGPASSAPSAKADVKAVAVPLIPVDELARKPESFQGRITVSGRVLGVSPGGDSFTLGCEDACVRVPVHFKGKAPEDKADVVVRGRVTKNLDGLYILEAESVEHP